MRNDDAHLFEDEANKIGFGFSPKWTELLYDPIFHELDP
jgi:hypothetical protein